ncbi:nuclear transport factor 2 family protein [Gramella sp. AN32]|uniref:Nuclear transport factor 2 family protein n=1 Tax=Christiangramia antarctica TaxID=2058158 RepID=A0ABW5X7I9_9FLAO|nr:nuclear transport factor 2 family protein [Gramella sp. AN32]
MEFLKNFNIAFAKGDLKFISESVTDEIVWNIIGKLRIEGKEQFSQELERLKSEQAKELIIDQILSHGKEGAVNGIIELKNGKKYAFSDFYKFKGAKGVTIKSITTYVIEI